MEACYRGMPKFVGAFFDTLYQHLTIMLIVMAGITALVGSWWYKANKKTQKAKARQNKVEIKRVPPAGMDLRSSMYHRRNSTPPPNPPA